MFTFSLTHLHQLNGGDWLRWLEQFGLENADGIRLELDAGVSTADWIQFEMMVFRNYPVALAGSFQLQRFSDNHDRNLLWHQAAKWNEPETVAAHDGPVDFSVDSLLAANLMANWIFAACTDPELVIRGVIGPTQPCWMMDRAGRRCTITSTNLQRRWARTLTTQARPPLMDFDPFAERGDLAMEATLEVA